MLAPPKTDVFESWQWVSQGCKDLKGLQTCIIPNHKISNGRSKMVNLWAVPPPKDRPFSAFC